MKILHTSDWHLGRTLYGKKRYEEFTAFLDWLIQTINEQQIDTLLICGDIFDTTLPSNHAQSLYYKFLTRASLSYCSHIIIIGGNHDSPSFLDAPKELLKAIHVQVIGSACEDIEEEVITLYDEAHTPQAIIAAVPYLHDKDIRSVESGETFDDKSRKLVHGIKDHYERMCSLALEKREKLANTTSLYLPIIATGHLFTAGGKTVEDDGVRDLYVGSLAHVNEHIFPQSIDYLALGHLHISQTVGSTTHYRYSGSPIPMGFGEAHQKKKVNIITFEHSKRTIEELEIPTFQELVPISGSLDEILEAIEQAKERTPLAWLEVDYTKGENLFNLREKLECAIEGSSLLLLRIKNRIAIQKLLQQSEHKETLDDLDVYDVFNRLLSASEYDDDEKQLLQESYKEIIIAFQEEDLHEL